MLFSDKAKEVRRDFLLFCHLNSSSFIGHQKKPHIANDKADIDASFSLLPWKRSFMVMRVTVVTRSNKPKKVQTSWFLFTNSLLCVYLFFSNMLVWTSVFFFSKSLCDILLEITFKRDWTKTLLASSYVDGIIITQCYHLVQLRNDPADAWGSDSNPLIF